MSSVPTGSEAPSMAAIFAARRWASVTPRVRRPTNVTSLAPPVFSRISWAMRVSARSRAAVSSTSAFSRKRGGRVVIILSLRTSQGPLKGKRRIARHFTRATTVLSTRDGGEQRHQLLQVHRLREVRLEAGLEGRPHVLGLAVSGQGDEPRGGEVGARADTARDLESVDVGQADVAQDDVRTHALDGVQPRLAALGGLDGGAIDLQHQLQHVARVGVVLDDQHRVALEARAPAGGRRAGDGLGTRQRQLDAEARALAEAGRGHADGAVVQLGEPAHEIETDAETAASCGLPALAERLEDDRQVALRDALAAVVDLDHRALVARLEPHADAAAGGCDLRGLFG